MANYINCYLQNYVNYGEAYSRTDCAFQLLQLNHHIKGSTSSCPTRPLVPHSNSCWNPGYLGPRRCLLSTFPSSKVPASLPLSSWPRSLKADENKFPLVKKVFVSFPTGEVNSIVEWLPKRHLNTYNNSWCSPDVWDTVTMQGLFITNAENLKVYFHQTQHVSTTKLFCMQASTYLRCPRVQSYQTFSSSPVRHLQL